MIDVETEKLIPLSEVPKLPWLPAKRKPTVQTVYAWSTRGIKGTQLETLAMGGCRCTTQAMLVRFFERLSIAPSNRANVTTPAQSRRAHEAAKKTLKRFGI